MVNVTNIVILYTSLLIPNRKLCNQIDTITNAIILIFSIIVVIFKINILIYTHTNLI